jgi:outer membrane biosynthesis protein TonB
MMFLVAVLIAMSGAIPNAASNQQQAEQKNSTAQMCWADEIRNPNPGAVKPPLLSPELASAEVRRTAVLLKVCIRETGQVDRVLVLKSTGNVDVDSYFVKEMSKRTFKPLRRANANVRSAAEVAVLFHR